MFMRETVIQVMAFDKSKFVNKENVAVAEITRTW